MDAHPDEIWPGMSTGKSGPLLCLLHGFLGTKEDWSDISNDLADTARCVAYDLPGHGANTAPHGINDMASAVKELDTQRHLAFREPWHLVGYSMGGRFALMYAAMFPKSVLSLTLISSSPGIEDEPSRANRRKRDAEWALNIQRLPASEFVPAWYAQSVFKSLEARPDLKEYIFSRRSQYHPRMMAQILQNWGQGNVPALWNRLNDLSCPVQMIVGSEDETYVRHLARMRDLSPSIEGVMVQHAGHTVHLEQPAEVAHHIRNFTGKR